MKKTLLALAVPALLAAGSANAAINLYNSNGVVVDLGAAAEVQYFKAYDENQDPTLRIDDGDLFVNTTIEIMPGMRAIATVGFTYETDGQNSADVESDELFVGFSSDFGTTTFGRQYTIADGAGNSKDYELQTNGIGFGDTQSARVIKYMYDNGGTFYGGFSTILDNDASDTASAATGTDGLIGLRFMGVDTRVFIYSGKNMEGSYVEASAGQVHLQKIEGFNFEIDYAINAFDFSAGYGVMDFKGDTIKDGNVIRKAPFGENKVTTWQVSAGYQADERTYFAAGVAYLDSKPSGDYKKYEGHNFYTNVTYALHNNAKVYAEAGISDYEIDGVDTDVQDIGYVLGMEVSF